MTVNLKALAVCHKKGAPYQPGTAWRWRSPFKPIDPAAALWQQKQARARPIRMRLYIERSLPVPKVGMQPIRRRQLIDATIRTIARVVYSDATVA